MLCDKVWIGLKDVGRHEVSTMPSCCVEDCRLPSPRHPESNHIHQKVERGKAYKQEHPEEPFDTSRKAHFVYRDSFWIVATSCATTTYFKLFFLFTLIIEWHNFPVLSGATTPLSSFVCLCPGLYVWARKKANRGCCCTTQFRQVWFFFISTQHL